jgi:L-lactate dehydrogenase complex protein LldF
MRHHMLSDKRNRVDDPQHRVSGVGSGDLAFQHLPQPFGAGRRVTDDRHFTATVAISGANFGIADTGTLCVVESEGNGRGAE